MFKFRVRLSRINILVLTACLVLIAPTSLLAAPRRVHQVTVPLEDRFTPFVLTIHAGESVQWVNRDTDNHTVVSDDFFNTTNNRGLNQLLPGTDDNHGNPGVLTLRFTKPGTFVYYCRFHAHLDSFHQPVAPGPDGGIQDANGNFGTPMSGIVVVLPDDD